MANELVDVIITTQWVLANVAASATAAMSLADATGDGFTVPTGHKFYPMYLYLGSNADATAGTAVAKVTDDGTAIANGPEPTLSDTVQEVSAVARVTQSAGIAAGHVVGIKVTSASLDPTTLDMSAILVGKFVPA